MTTNLLIRLNIRVEQVEHRLGFRTTVDYIHALQHMALRWRIGRNSATCDRKMYDLAAQAWWCVTLIALALCLCVFTFSSTNVLHGALQFSLADLWHAALLFPKHATKHVVSGLCSDTKPWSFHCKKKPVVCAEFWDEDLRTLLALYVNMFTLDGTPTII